MNWVKFGKIVKIARVKKGLTQRELAKYVKVTPESISYYESGKKHPSFDKIKTICEVLNLDARKL